MSLSMIIACNNGVGKAALAAAEMMAIPTIVGEGGASNIEQSDGTLFISSGWRGNQRPAELSADEKLFKQFSKPHWTIETEVGLHQEIAQDIRRWTRNKNITVLNVTGSPEHLAPGIAEFTQELVMMLLSLTDEQV